MKIVAHWDYFQDPVGYFARPRWASPRERIAGWKWVANWFEGNYCRSASTKGVSGYMQLSLHNLNDQDCDKLVAHLNTLDFIRDEAYGVCN